MKIHYSIKVWLSTLIAAPIAWVTVLMIVARDLFLPEGIMIVTYTSVIGGVVSLPTLFVYHLACSEFAQTKMPTLWVRVLSAFVAIGGLLFTNYLIFREDAFQFGVGSFADMTLCYALAILVFSFIYRPRRVPSQKADIDSPMN